MSSRFGRNQRRRLRAALEFKEAEVVAIAGERLRALSQVSDKDREISALRAMLDDVQDRVGKYALAGAEPEVFKHSYMDLRRENNFHMTAQPALRPCSYTDCANMSQTVQIHDDLMAVMHLELRDGMTVQEKLSRDMHCRLHFDKVTIGYAISHSAIRYQSRKAFVARVAPEIALFLEIELQKVGMRP